MFNIPFQNFFLGRLVTYSVYIKRIIRSKIIKKATVWNERNIFHYVIFQQLLNINFQNNSTIMKVLTQIKLYFYIIININLSNLLKMDESSP